MEHRAQTHCQTVGRRGNVFVSRNSFSRTVSALRLAGEDLRMINLFPHWFGMAHHLQLTN